MIFLDTSAIYALADATDHNHEAAIRHFHAALDSHEELLVHSGILVESAALLQNRLGLDAALLFLEESEAFVVHWVTEREHTQAVDTMRSRGRRGLSLVDCASFVVMRFYGVQRALAFDRDFQDEGFAIYEP